MTIDEETWQQHREDIDSLTHGRVPLGNVMGPNPSRTSREYLAYKDIRDRLNRLDPLINRVYNETANMKLWNSFNDLRSELLRYGSGVPNWPTSPSSLNAAFFTFAAHLLTAYVLRRKRTRSNFGASAEEHQQPSKRSRIDLCSSASDDESDDESDVEYSAFAAPLPLGRVRHHDKF